MAVRGPLGHWSERGLLHHQQGQESVNLVVILLADDLVTCLQQVGIACVRLKGGTRHA
jgi:hypothetical protein